MLKRLIKYLFFICFLLSCSDITNIDPNNNTTGYFIYSIDCDGNQNQEIIKLDYYPQTIEISNDSKKFLLYGRDHGIDIFSFINLENNVNDTLRLDCSDHYTKPSFSHDSSKFVATQKDLILLYDIIYDEIDSIHYENVDGFAIFSQDDQHIIFTTLDSVGKNYEGCLAKIKIDDLNKDTLFSYCSWSSEQASIKYPTLSSMDDLYFISNGKLHKTDLDGSNPQNFGISVDSYTPIYTSPNADLILANKAYYSILLCTSDGMDFTTLPYSGRKANFINNNECVFYNSDKVKIGKVDGSSSYKIADGRFPKYCLSDNKIYYLCIKD